MKKLFLLSCFIFILFTNSAFANPVIDIAPITMLISPTHMWKAFVTSMLLAGVIETFLLWCLGYKKWTVLTYFFILNLLSNYVVNNIYNNDYPSVLSLEIAAILFESLALGLLTKYSLKLFRDVTITNIISFLIGTALLFVL